MCTFKYMNAYRFISLYMLDSWCRTFRIYLISFTLLRLVFFRIRTFISERWDLFTNSMLCIFTAYNCMYFILASVLCMCASVSVYILLCKIEFCMYVFIFWQKLFQLMFIVEVDPTLNKDYLIFYLQSTGDKGIQFVYVCRRYLSREVNYEVSHYR